MIIIRATFMSSLSNLRKKMPRLPGFGTAATELIRLRLRKLQAPIAHSFVGQDHAVCDHALFDVGVTQAGAGIEPDTVSDDRRREPMALVGGWQEVCV
jgi:hypothetical protein